MIDNLKIYLLDILTILLPGALLIAVFAQFSFLTNMFLSVFPESSTEWINVVVYVGLAYIIGHFIFFIGSFLDDWIFENVKRVFWNDPRLVAYIIECKKERTGIEDRRVINAFKWSCAWLLANKPDMYSVVERHIAESKFFRSLVIVLFISLLVFTFKASYLLASIILFLVLLSLVRYLTQRQKSIETAYHFIITVSRKAFNSQPDQDIVAQLAEKNIDPCNDLIIAESSIAIKVWALRTYCSLRKVLVVLNLCLNPFYKTIKRNV